MIRGRWLLAALAVLALAWGPEWDRILDPFPGHMLRHMLLVAVAAPLLALGLPVLGRFAPPVTLAAALEFLVVWAFHLPALHVPAQLMPGAFALEQAAFLLAGIAVWSSALPPTHPLAGAGGLLLTSMHMTFLGLLSFGRGDHPGREQRTGTATGRCLLSSRWPSPIRKHMTEHGTRRVAGPEGPHLGGTYEQSAQVRPGLRVDRRPRRVASSPSASSASSSRRPPFGPHDLPLNPNQPL